MASAKLTQLTALTAPAPEDLVYVVDDVAGTPVERKVTLEDLAKGFRVINCTGQSLTGSQATSLVDLATTWNTTGTPTAIKLNVTDTASNAASLLMDLQVGASSKFRVRKNGLVTTGGFALDSTILSGGTTVSSGLEMQSSTQMYLNVNGSTCLKLTSTGLRANGGYLFIGGSGVEATLVGSLNVLELQNGTNAQTYRVYGTYTDASNYRRVQLAMTTAGVATLAPVGAGTGSSGNVLHISGLPTSNPGPGILWNNAGTPAIGT